MFRSVITHAITMALADFNQGHTHLMEIAEMVHVTVITAVIEVEANRPGASITGIVIVHVATRCHVGTVARQIA